jgi:hypothetical protein
VEAPEWPFAAASGIGPNDARFASLDFSLQLEVSIQSLRQFNDKNPCATTPAVLTAPLIGSAANAPRVQRYPKATDVM